MPTTLTARGPEDLLAAVPVVLGFHPADSLVMLTFRAERAFHARLDLPDSPDGEAIGEAVDALLAPCRSHEVGHVAFVVYTDDRGLAAAVAAALVPAFVADGIGVVDVLRADGGCWCSVPIRSGAEESSPVPCAQPATSAPEATRANDVRILRERIECSDPRGLGAGHGCYLDELPHFTARNASQGETLLPSVDSSDIRCQDSVTYSVRQPSEG